MSVLLHTYTARLLAKYFKTKGLVEIVVNQPGEIWLETYDGWQRKQDKALSLDTLLDWASALATYRGQVFSDAVPLLSTTLPGSALGADDLTQYRVQALGGSIVESGFAMSIRIAQARIFDLDDYRGAAEAGKAAKAALPPAKADDIDVLRWAIQHQKNVLISGGTSSGKTTFLNSCCALISDEDRIIAVEDSKEILLRQPNTVRILKSKSGTDIAKISYASIINACMRMRPDRILLGEFDIENTMPFLRVLNTGHGGSLATLHANSPLEALEAIAQNCGLAGYNSNEAIKYARKAFDYIVQCYRISRKEFRIKIVDVKTLKAA